MVEIVNLAQRPTLKKMSAIVSQIGDIKMLGSYPNLKIVNFQGCVSISGQKKNVNFQVQALVKKKLLEFARCHLGALQMSQRRDSDLQRVQGDHW